jgi:hypothetical protein
MGKVKQTVQHDFQAPNEQELDRQLATFKAEHESQTGQRLAIDAKRPLGPGKVRITFRVVAVAARKR